MLSLKASLRTVFARVGAPQVVDPEGLLRDRPACPVIRKVLDSRRRKFVLVHWFDHWENACQDSSRYHCHSLRFNAHRDVAKSELMQRAGAWWCCCPFANVLDRAGLVDSAGR